MRWHSLPSHSRETQRCVGCVTCTHTWDTQPEVTSVPMCLAAGWLGGGLHKWRAGLGPGREAKWRWLGRQSHCCHRSLRHWEPCSELSSPSSDWVSLQSCGQFNNAISAFLAPAILCQPPASLAQFTAGPLGNLSFCCSSPDLPQAQI